MRLQFIVYLTFLLLSEVKMELITDQALSVISMKNLVEMEDLFIGELTKYATALQEKINTIESFLKEVQTKQDISKRNPEEFVTHPLNGYSLIRRLHEDWSFFEAYMSKIPGSSHLENIENILKDNLTLDMYLEDAIVGMSSMQVFHDMESTDIARGYLMGNQYNATLNPLECLAMASYAALSGQEQSSINWHEAALQQYDELEHGDEFREVFDFTLSQVYHKYTKSLLVKGSRRASLDLLREVSDYDVELWQLQRQLEKESKAFVPDSIYIKPPLSKYQKLCKGQPTTQNSKQYCFYDRRRTSFLTIAPLKTEILSLDPYIAIFHDVIHESEIKRVKNVSISSFKGPLRYSSRQEYNLQFAKVHEDQQSLLNKRIKDMTGEEVAQDDKDFDIYNYGLGGYSNHHLDVPSEEDEEAGLGNYLTSVVFFLNDLDEGGAVAFPKPNLTVWPKKGSALVWRNLDNTLELDLRLVHFSCPVVMGSKWTLVKWLHEVPQVFARPCRMSYNEFIA